jgi:hypothetical protein
MRLGIEKSAMIRIRAGISYALTEAMTEGHCGLPTDELAPLAEKLLGVPVELVRTALGLGCVKTKSDLVVKPSEGRIFAFCCSERDQKPQNSGCGYTTPSFHTAWVLS